MAKTRSSIDKTRDDEIKNFFETCLRQKEVMTKLSKKLENMRLERRKERNLRNRKLKPSKMKRAQQCGEEENNEPEEQKKHSVETEHAKSKLETPQMSCSSTSAVESVSEL